MRKITLFFLGISLMGLTGCATSPLPLLGIKEMTTETISLEITSTPSDADVYLNNMLVGRTPCSVPFSVNVDAATLKPKGMYIIRVSKEGYRDEVKPVQIQKTALIDFTSYPSGTKFVSPQLAILSAYNFVLKKRE